MVVSSSSHFILYFIYLYIANIVTDKVLLGISNNKAFYIITDKEEEVNDYIMRILNHSVTIFDVKEKANNKLNIDKVIGMLCVFKYFKPFLEKCLNSMNRQENILTKLLDLTEEVHYMEALYKYDDE